MCLDFSHGKSHNFISYFSLESCVSLQPGAWGLDNKDHEDFRYLKKHGESMGQLLGCVNPEGTTWSLLPCFGLRQCFVAFFIQSLPNLPKLKLGQ